MLPPSVLVHIGLTYYSIYIEDLESTAEDGTLDLDFERDYMFHTAFIHGHAHYPPLDTSSSSNVDTPMSENRKFFGSVQPAVFDGPRVWSAKEKELVELSLARIAPVMKACGESAPPRASLE